MSASIAKGSIIEHDGVSYAIIFVIRRDGSGLRNLTRHPAHDDTPDW